jgi:hypothetical protein
MILLDTYNSLKPGPERQAFRIANHADLEKAKRRYDPQSANTLAAALTPDYLADALVINARNRLAPLAAFSRDFGTDPLKPRAIVQVKRATAGATAQTNPTNWESGDTTATNIAVTVNAIAVSFHLTFDQINKGWEIANLAGINADQFCDAISDVWTALLLAATYGTPVAWNGSNLGGIIGTAPNFDPTDVPQLFAMAKNFRRRNLILDGSYIGFIMPGLTAAGAGGIGANPNAGQSTYFGPAYGLDGVWMQNRYTGAIANCVGFLCGPDAIGVASGLPLETSAPSGEFISQQVVNIDSAGSNAPSIGLSAQVNVWYARASRTVWASFDVMFGAAAGDASTTVGQGRLLVSA